jgi:hypothetical protein
MRKVDFYCNNCKKSMKMSYEITGNPNKLVMSGVIIRCHTHKCIKVVTLKKYTEGQLAEHVTNDGKVYI